MTNDAPSGLGSNAQMDAIDALLQQAPLSGQISGIAVGTVPVWDGSGWVKPGGTPDGTKFLRDDGTWATASAVGAPTGAIMPYAGASAPTDWLLCDGSAVSQATYSALFAVIGHTYGADPGGGNFILPDLRGRMAVGKGTNATVSTLGNNDGVAVGNRRPQHRHTPHSHSYPVSNDAAGAGSVGVQGTDDNSPGSRSVNAADGGSGNANDSLDAPAYLVLNYIIRT